MFVETDKFFISGATGFLGREICKALIRHGISPRQIFTASRRTYIDNHLNINYFTCDLLNKEEVHKLIIRERPTYVINLAGENGGVVYNRDWPSWTFFNNSVCPLNVFDALKKTPNLRKVISIISSCAYDATHCETRDLKEGEFLEGQPDKSVACHGYAKRNVFLMSRFFASEKNIPSVSVVLPTIYGPRMEFSPNKSKFVAAFIQKIYDANYNKQKEVQFFGNGKLVSREIIYVEDAADLVIKSLLRYNDSNEVLNLTLGQTYTLELLASKIAALQKYEGKLLWTGELTGQLRKTLDGTKFRTMFNSYIGTSLEKGLENSIEYYRQLAENGRSDR